jgi:hypothetical protein
MHRISLKIETLKQSGLEDKMPSEPAFSGLYAENALLLEHFWYHKIYFSIIYRFGVWCRTFRGYRAVSFGFLPPIGFVDKKILSR